MKNRIWKPSGGPGVSDSAGLLLCHFPPFSPSEQTGSQEVGAPGPSPGHTQGKEQLVPGSGWETEAPLPTPWFSLRQGPPWW